MSDCQNMDEASLLEHIRQGSHPAFAALVERHTARFYRLAFRYVSQKEAAEDVVQRAFLKLWEKPSRWDPERKVKFTTWFSRVVINLGLDMQKKRTPLLLAEHYDVADEAEGQERQLIDAQQKVQLEHAIRRLPARQQTALNLCFYEEITNAEAARIMETTVGAIESLLMRAKANLRTELKQYELESKARERKA